MKCMNCKKDYASFAIANYNLSLCRKCIDKFEKEGRISRDYLCDKITHKITCPKCGRVYKELIVDTKCKTKNCKVWFFWDDLDCAVFARWIK